MDVRRKTRAFALGELRFGEAGVVVADQRLEHRVPGVARLHQHFARLLAAAGTAADLRERGKKPFRGTVVRRQQCAVRIEDADQRQVREVVPFGEQLRAHQDVAFAAADAFQRAREFAAAADAVAVDAQDARLREQRGQRLLDPLGAAPERPEIDVAAGRASVRDRLLRTAVMTAQVIRLFIIG